MAPLTNNKHKTDSERKTKYIEHGFRTNVYLDITSDNNTDNNSCVRMHVFDKLAKNLEKLKLAAEIITPIVQRVARLTPRQLVRKFLGEII